MPSITFFALINEGTKLEIYEKKNQLTIAAYPYMSDDDRETVSNSLILPDDVLSDILEDETPDDINILKDALNNGN